MPTIALVVLELLRLARTLVEQHGLDEMARVELDYEIEELRRYGQSSRKPPTPSGPGEGT